MSEIITTYKLNDPGDVFPMDRDEFYEGQIAEYRKNGKPTRSVAIVDILLFTPDKQLILQERSKHKKHNPGMIDKSMGGHVKFGDTPTYTVMLETLEELNIPAFVLDSEDDFKKTYRLLINHIKNTCLVQFIASRTANLKNLFGKEEIPIAKKYYLYLGIYNGALKPADREAAGLKYADFDNLSDEIREIPEKYTDDLKFFLSKYEDEIKEFLKNI